MTTLRIRKELKATPVEEAGVSYVDVSDPRSGESMRLYDFEWLIAERLAGSSPSEVATWAHQRFGFTTSAHDLIAFAGKLDKLGFVETHDSAAFGRGVAVRPTEPMAAVAPPPPSPAARVSTPEPTMQLDMDAIELDSGPVAPEPPTAPIAPPPIARPITAEVPLPAPTPLHPSLVLTDGPREPDRPAASTMQIEPDVEAQRPAVQLISPTVPVAPIDGGTEKRSSGVVWVLLLFLLGAGGYLVYDFLIAPGMEAARVKVSAAPAAKEFVKTYDGKATVGKAEGLVLSFGEAGKVADVMVAGNEVKEGTTVARLDGAAAIEKELADTHERESFYAAQLKAAQAKNNLAEVKKNEEKLAEKRKRIADLEARATKVRLVATGPGTIAEVMVTAGSAVNAGDAAVKLADKRTTVDFNLIATDAAGIKAGSAAAVVPETGGSASATAKVLDVNGSTVKVELLDDAGGTIKAGDAVLLVRAKVPNVIMLPLGSVMTTPEGEVQVFVLEGGVLRARPVTVLERSATDAFVSLGVRAGDQVVQNPTEQLKEGQKASVE
ncbi:MAG: hypothetical protein EXR72_04130 [Myxococcales bacterium]|nr:hypothetical protein [Myxococcales bacterium]